MKTALISDIHGNAVALDAVLKDIEARGVDQIAVLGDLCFRGPEPKRALEMVRRLVQEKGAHVIKGNVDEWTVRPVREGEVPAHFLPLLNREREWCLSQLGQEDVDWLSALPHELRLQVGEQLELYACHATPDSLFDVLWPDAPDQEIAGRLLREEPAQLFAYGHIHHPYTRFVQGKAVLNTGSVGLPFDGVPQASYILVESKGSAYQAGVVRVPFDVEETVRLYEQHDYPEAELMARVLRQAVSPFELN